MSRQNKIVLLSVAALALLGGGAWWYLTRSRNCPDVVYATHDGVTLTLDLEYPEARASQHPVVVFIPPEGDWHPDVKRDRRFRTGIQAFNGAGFVVAVLHFRKPDQCKFPGPVEDAKAAVRFLRANAGRYGLDPDRIAAVGVSWGGYLASMLGTTETKDGFGTTGELLDTSARVQAVVTLGAPADLANKTWPDVFEKKVMVPFLGQSFDANPGLYRKASPGTFASKDDPPFLLFHATGDKLVPVHHARTLVNQLKQAGVSVRLVEVPTEQHIFEGESLEKTTGEAAEFLKKCFGS